MNLNPTNILLVDQNHETLAQNQKLLEQQTGFHIVTVSTIEDAIDRIGNHSFDLVLAAHPQQNPNEALNIFTAARNRNRAVRTALINTYPDLNQMDSARQVVMTQTEQITVQPTQPNQLIQMVQQLLNRKPGQQVQEQGEEQEETVYMEPHEEAGFMLERLVSVATEQWYINVWSQQQIEANDPEAFLATFRIPERTQYVTTVIRLIARRITAPVEPLIVETADSYSRARLYGSRVRQQQYTVENLINEARALEDACRATLAGNGIDSAVWRESKPRVIQEINRHLAESIEGLVGLQQVDRGQTATASRA